MERGPAIEASRSPAFDSVERAAGHGRRAQHRKDHHMTCRKKTHRRLGATALALAVSMCGLSATARADTAAERLAESAAVLKEVMDTPDKGIPEDLLKAAYCVVIVPGVKKAGLVVGGSYGRGFAVCRKDNLSGWGAPAAVRVEGGSVGFQIGASETDLIMLVMDPRSMNGVLSSKFTLGGAAEASAGPVGRSSTAQTDASMRAKILSYSRSRGAFAGVALTGATLRQDLDENKEMYGTSISNREILNGGVKPPAAAADLLALLNKYSRREA
jgi:SH3 domain-containing YSC84-like protein 1